MKKLIITLALLLSAEAYSATVRLNWTESPNDVTGQPVQLTKFSVYWGPDSLNLANSLDLGPPVPLPWKFLPNGFGYYSKTITRPEWVSGTTVCFAMQAFAGAAQSGLSNIVCKQLTGNPMNPDLINLDQIP